VYPPPIIEAPQQIADQLTLEIPLRGEIGNGGVERLFCRLAHRALQGQAINHHLCPALADDIKCTLAGDRLCLFRVPFAKVWLRIRKYTGQPNPRPFQVGDVVQIANSVNSLDCCADKRGRILRKDPGGLGWLLATDHLCPRPKWPWQLNLVPWTQQAQEHLDTKPPPIVQHYRQQPKQIIMAYLGEDRTAWATAVLQGWLKEPIQQVADPVI
jgi:hypothetical protein